MGHSLKVSFVLFLIYSSVQAQKLPENQLNGVWYRILTSNAIEAAFADCVVQTYQTVLEKFTKETIEKNTITGAKPVTQLYTQKGPTSFTLVIEQGLGTSISMDIKISNDKKFMCQKTSISEKFASNAILSRSRSFKPEELERAKKELVTLCTEKLYPVNQKNCKK